MTTPARHAIHERPAHGFHVPDATEVVFSDVEEGAKLSSLARKDDRRRLLHRRRRAR